MYAVRTIRLCTKDCLCLYVCPTGATDTENSVIDRIRCTGCGLCAKSCPSGAISMVPDVMPPQQPKVAPVVAAMRSLARSKSEQETAAAALPGVLAAALARSNRVMAEDLLREAGFMLPQSGNVRAELTAMLAQPHSEGFPREAAQKLLDTLPFNE
ncbi:MAG: 4Fe-4S binding protein [Eubacteriales bacterium]|nr:4Fe-4S binding protein [Eubacteriales bacterium]